MKVSQINIYPIKSLGGINLIDANVEISGFQYDRNWMLVDQNGKFLTQRSLPEMALLQVELQEKGLLVYHQLNPEDRIEIPFLENTGEKIEGTVWDDSVKTLHVSSKIDKWFSAKLKTNCQLVKMDLDNKRYIEGKYKVNNEHVSFADSMPFLIIGQSSLDDLNSKLEVPIPMARFRPNIVFTGALPFAEDDWDNIQIGQVRFKVTKPCARCTMITIDQKTGEKGKEPLTTLSQYRKVDGKILFGQNLIALDKGGIAVGNIIKLI
ncbi:MOSC domain-containing protein [Cyclobacterium qasimii]|uniref:Flavodoxin reductases (Ferredoxin-NADPH reductases) family 1 n=2 Tax=Cyclobacterium qasimii TaxID=1350429 RepID=S7VGU2_9BACT|nr:MOSC N-terminal beta barrel domain-containing protein [Cyclobacterium qasimii]EPR68717.1 Flavodoxin reductases (ferredoxin-NADPH reductases) family 1 [Cyclobacterium qasimii M12-11B]GEO22710.1 MOSC domain-containing protein [Cyclobacterium qasimii]